MKLLFLAALLASRVFAAVSSGDPTCTKGQATLRKSPNGPTAYKVAKYTPFLRQEIKGGWARVTDSEGESNWISPRELSTQLHCVIVKAQVATLRTQPSTSAPTADLKTVDRYTPFKRLESQGEWMHIEDEAGHQAWIHESTVWKPVKIQSVSF